MYMYMYSVRGYVNVHTGRSATVYDPTMGRRAAVNWGGPNQGMCSDLVRSLSEAQNQFVLLLDLPIRFIHAWELELTVTIGLVPQSPPPRTHQAVVARGLRDCNPARDVHVGG